MLPLLLLVSHAAAWHGAHLAPPRQMATPQHVSRASAPSMAAWYVKTEQFKRYATPRLAGAAASAPNVHRAHNITPCPSRACAIMFASC